MKLLVLLYKDLSESQKPLNIPDEWPAEVTEVDDSAPDPKDGRLLMDIDEFEKYKEKFRPQYDAWQEQFNLPLAKEEQFKIIDNNTDSLIDQGFDYNGQTFSLSIPAQTTLFGLYVVRDEKVLQYPIRINTIDDSDYLELNNSDEVKNFYLAAVAACRAHLDSGTVLKDQVRTAAAVTDLVSVVDVRLAQVSEVA